MIRIVFCFFGNCMLVRIGIGRKSMARSVIIFSGAEERYKVTIFVQVAESGTGFSKAAVTGRH